jgi:hypothetical protein
VLSTQSIGLKNQSHVKNAECDINDIDANDIDDTLIFKAFENGSGNERTCDEKRSCMNPTERNESENGKEEHSQKAWRTISKSVGCNPREHNRNFFSKDMAELLTAKIINVLREKSIGEIKLINMKEEDIQKIEELSQSQKNLIIQKIICARDNARKTPTYEDILEKVHLLIA